MAAAHANEVDKDDASNNQNDMYTGKDNNDTSGSTNTATKQENSNKDNLISWQCERCTFKNNDIDNMFECKMCQNGRNPNDLNKINTLVKFFAF